MKFFEKNVRAGGLANPRGLVSIMFQRKINGATRASQLLQNVCNLWLITRNGSSRKYNYIIWSEVNIFHFLIILRVQKPSKGRERLCLRTSQKYNHILRNLFFPICVILPVSRSKFIFIL